MSRPKERIDIILGYIETYWKENPDQRLGQMLENLFGEVNWHKEDIEYMKDEDLLWGSRGVDGTSPLEYNSIKDLEISHIQSILNENHVKGKRYKKAFTDELINKGVIDKETTISFQDKINKLIPYTERDFITIDAEYDFSFMINFHILLKKELVIPEEFEQWINVSDITETDSLDFTKFTGKDGIVDFSSIFSEGVKDWDSLPRKKLEKKIYTLYAQSSEDENGYNNVDTIDFVLDKVIEFIDLIKEENENK